MNNQDSIKTGSAAIFAVLSVLFVIFLIASSWPAFGKISDLPEFYAAARMVLEGRGTDVYIIDQQRIAQQLLFPATVGRTIGFFLSPFALPIIVPLGWVPIGVVQAVWKALLVGGLIVGIYLTRKIYDLNFRGTCWLIAVVCCSVPVYESLRIDQMGTLIFAAFMLAIFAIKSERPVLAALALSFMLLKPQLLLPFIIFLLGAQRYKILISLTVIGVILAGIGYLELGPQGVLNYKTLIETTATDSRFLQTALSPTIRGQLFRLLPESKGLVTTLTYGFFALSLVAQFVLGRIFAKSHKWLEAAVLCSIPLGMVTSPYFFVYDMMILLPALVVLMKEPLQDEIPPWMLLSCMLGAMIFTTPIAVQIHYEYLLKGGQFNPFFICLFLFGLASVWLALTNKKYFDEFV